MTNVELKEKLYRGIPVLNDEGFRNGKHDHIDGQTAVHYLINPFLNILGYNVFSPDEVKMNVTVGDGHANVQVLERGNSLAVLKIVDLNKVSVLDREKFIFQQVNLDKMKIFNSSVIILTNGLEYVIYSTLGGNTEELAHFNLLNLDETSSDFVINVLFKEKLIGSIGNSKFFTELIIESKLGNLRNSDYLLDVVRSELSNPSDDLLTIFARTLIDKYCTSMDIDRLRRSLKDEFLSNKGSLLTSLNVGESVPTKEVVTEEVKSEDKKQFVDPYTIVGDSESDTNTNVGFELGKSDDDFADGKELNGLLLDESSAGMDLGTLLKMSEEE